MKQTFAFPINLNYSKMSIHNASSHHKLLHILRLVPNFARSLATAVSVKQHVQ